jgi:D-alanine-D-alanine ligase
MKIGLTYDLRSEYLARGFSEEETAEFDREDTIDAIDNAIRNCGHQTDRIGSIQALIKRINNNDRWDLVFNVCEGLHGKARESQVPALLDACQIPYTFSNPLVLALSLDKFMCKSYLRQFEIPTPEYLLLEDESQLKDISLPYPLFVKPVSEGTGKGVDPESKVDNIDQLTTQFRKLKAKFNQPVLVEEFLPGREFTVGITGNGIKAKILGTMEIIIRNKSNNTIYSYESKENCETEVLYRPARDKTAKKAEEIALKAYMAIGCLDAGRIDIRQNVQGNPEFMEINPIPGLHPLHSDLPMIATQENVSYQHLIETILASATERYPHLKK